MKWFYYLQAFNKLLPAQSIRKQIGKLSRPTSAEVSLDRTGFSGNNIVLPTDFRKIDSGERTGRQDKNDLTWSTLGLIATGISSKLSPQILLFQEIKVHLKSWNVLREFLWILDPSPHSFGLCVREYLSIYLPTYLSINLSINLSHHNISIKMKKKNYTNSLKA